MSIRRKNKYLVFVISLVQLIFQCQCHAFGATTESPSSATATIGAIKPRKLSNDAIESITSDTHLLNQNELPWNTNEFSYYQHEPITIHYSDPVVNSYPIQNQIQPTNPPSTVNNPVNYSHQQYAQTPFLPINYVPSERHNIMQIHRAPFQPTSPFQDIFNFQHSIEQQYITSFRNIKTSVMQFFYKMQDFVNYVMSFFSPGEFCILYVFLGFVFVSIKHSMKRKETISIMSRRRIDHKSAENILKLIYFTVDSCAALNQFSFRVPRNKSNLHFDEAKIYCIFVFVVGNLVFNL